MVSESGDKENSHLNRERGILTESDRRYLLGLSEIEPSSQSERNARARIRRRVQHALIDFTLLVENLEERDLDQILRGNNLDSEDRERLNEALFDVVALISRTEHPPRQVLYEAGLERALRRKDLAAEVDIDINITRLEDATLDELRDQHDDPNAKELLEYLQNPKYSAVVLEQIRQQIEQEAEEQDND
jgi:hypothetical protein